MSNARGLQRAIFAGGGTAGHLFPGLAVARCLRDQFPQAEFLFVGSGLRREQQWVHAQGFPYRTIACRPFPRKLSEVVPFLWNNLRGYVSSRRLLQPSPCDVVIGLGGYASVPIARAAIRASVPLVLLEQNLLPGRATRWLAHHAAAVCTAFAETAQRLPHPDRVVVTGNPLRAEFESRFQNGTARVDFSAAASRFGSFGIGTEGGPAAVESAPRTDRRLVVLGGSSGARSLNRAVPQALARLRRVLEGWQIVHLAGSDDVEPTRLLYARLGIPAQVCAFVTEMPQLLRQTDLAVCRAGGTTLAELTASGVPAVLVPYPHAAADHQRANAWWAAAAGGCACVEEDPPGEELADALIRTVAPLISDEPKRRQMSRIMRRLGRPEAAGNVAAVIRRVVGEASCGRSAARGY